MRVMFLFCSPPPWAKVLIIPHIKSHGQNAVCLKSAAELPGSRFGEQMDGILAFSKGTSYLRHWGFQWIGVNISGQPTLHCEAVIPSQFKYCRHKFSKKHPSLVQMLLWFGSWTNTFFLFLPFSLFGVCPSGKKKFAGWAGELGTEVANWRCHLFTSWCSMSGRRPGTVYFPVTARNREELQKRFYSPSEELWVFGCGGGESVSSQVGPILRLGQAQLPLTGLQRAPCEHSHRSLQSGP